MHSLSRLSLRNRALTALLTIFLVVAGIWATGSLKRELIPSIEFPVIGVVTPVPGAGASVVEDRVTRPVEQAALGVRGVESVESTSGDSASTVLVTLEYGTDIGAAQADTQRAVLALQDLPEGAEPQVFAGSIDDFPVIQMSVSGGADRQELQARVRDQMVPKIEDIDGVRAAAVTGVPEQLVTVTLDARRLAAAEVTPEDVTALLDDNGVVIPAGQLASGEETLTVQAGSAITDLDQLRALPVKGATTLGEVSTVELTQGDTTALSRTDGEPSLVVSVTKTPDGNTVAISDELEKLRPELDSLVTDGRTTIVFDQAPFINDSIKDLAVEGALGLFFAVLVVFVFLLSIRLTLVTAVSIPLSLLVAMLGLRMGGYTLNILTLGALTIAVGRVVDDSIVVIENIQRHLRMGEPKRVAIPDAVREVASAITSSTLTTVAVFLPLGLVGGQVGELFRPFAVTVTLAMLASLFVALTIVPVLGYWFLRSGPAASQGAAEPEPTREYAVRPAELVTAGAGAPALGGSPVAAPPGAAAPGAAALGAGGNGIPAPAGHEGQGGHGGDGEDGAPTPVRIREQDEPVTRLQRSYLPALDLALRAPWLTIALGVVILALSGFGATLLKTDFLGDQGGNTLTITQQLPAGTSLAATDEAAKRLEATLAGREDVESYQVTVGAAGPEAAFTGAGTGTATFTVTTTDAGTDGVAQAVRAAGEADPSLGTVTASTGGNFGATAAEIVVRAPDDASLRQASAAITEEVKRIDGARDVTNDLAALAPTVRVSVDRAKAEQAGLSETAVGGIVAGALRGTPIGEVTLDGIGHDVVLRQGADVPASVDQLRALPVGAAPGGQPLTLGQVAAVRQVEEPVTLSRVDGARTATVSATPTSGDLGSVTAALNDVVADTDLPEGASAEVAGVSADQAEAFGQLGLALLVAIALTYAVLVATFGSLLQPLILMVSVPFAATGAIALLLLTDTPLGVASIIGVLMLVGIVVTNAIVLIDLVNQYRARGLGVREAVREGGRHRFRPIIMTALATVLALTPMAFAITGGGAFISQPLAIVVIGGLLSSTLLTLILVPAIYTLVEEFRQKRGFGADHRGEVL
ncbi:MAG TPA: efflux RND transporter permease subunit [Dermatophilaceae bacterium]|nr:efflux RND transporter permease subunit [Dermatophilaceae bacterium]